MTQLAKQITDDFKAVKAAEEHDNWVREEVAKTLKAKSEGRVTYKSLGDVVAKFDAHAR